MTDQPTSLKVVLCEHRPFGNTEGSLTAGTSNLESFTRLLRPAYTARHAETSIPTLMTLGLGLPPFQRPKDDLRPVVVGLVCLPEQLRRTREKVEAQLSTIPPNTFLIICCVGQDQELPPLNAPPSSQYRLVQPAAIRGKDGQKMRAEIKRWRSTLSAPHVA